MKTNQLLLIFSFFLFFANVSCKKEKEQEPLVPTMETMLCHRWECYRFVLGTTERNMEKSMYMTFVQDGQLIVERDDIAETEIYSWSKSSDNAILMSFPMPVSELNDILKPLLSVDEDENIFKDTMLIDANINQLTDSSLILFSEIEWKRILTDDIYYRLNAIPIIKNLVNSTSKCELYFRRKDIM